MKIAIEKNILTSALDIVSKAVSTKSTLPILEGVLLEAEGKTLRLTGNNLEIAIQHTVECDVLGPGKIVVEAKLFQDIVKRMPNEEIDITAADGKMTIEAGDTKMEIKVLPAEHYPAPTKIECEKPFEMDAKILREMVNGVSFAVAIVETRPILTGVLLDARENCLRIVAIDGFSMALRKTEINCGEFKTVIKGKDIETAAKVLSGEKIKILANDTVTNAIIETDTTKVSLRTLEGEYLDYKQIVPSEFSTTVKLDVKEIQQILDRASLLTWVDDKGRRYGHIEVTVNYDEIRFQMQTEKGTLDERLKVDTQGEKLSIRFSPDRLSSCLKHIEEKEILMKFTTETGPCVMVPVEGDKFLCFALPLRR